VAWFREWLEGRDRAPVAPARPAPAAREVSEAPASTYPGERFGLPEAGRGSVATLARRGGQFALDALLAGLLALLFTFPVPPQNWSLLTWAIIMVVPVAVVGATPAMALLGMRVVRLDRPDRAGVGLLWTLVRTFSVFFVIPALIVDRDARGVQDRASRTVVVMTR
jgi:uncharacterized RDD family membrane protein YckC